MKNLFIVSVLFFVVLQFAIANPFDTGWKTYYQPNGITFIGRQQGDEFYFYSVTNNGYYFIQDYATGWFYYAAQQTNGKFASNGSKVVMDYPSSLCREIDSNKVRFAIEKTKEQIFFE
ncbi:MAG: hypothetical protein H3C35_02405 [Bacteroidetes bacterium]|nr:hypothetical protein [Bacteroidota bacterium]